jgi:hypothetical protein
MQQYPKKRRVVKGPSKNELRAARGDRDEKNRARSGVLRQRFPRVERLELDLRLETPAGTTLEHSHKLIGRDDSLTLDVPCLGGCGGGLFLLTEAVEAMLQAGTETRDSMAICQAASYADARTPCGTKLYYQINVDYTAEPAAE